MLFWVHLQPDSWMRRFPQKCPTHWPLKLLRPWAGRWALRWVAEDSLRKSILRKVMGDTGAEETVVDDEVGVEEDSLRAGDIFVKDPSLAVGSRPVALCSMGGAVGEDRKQRNIQCRRCCLCIAATVTTGRQVPHPPP